MTIVFMPKEVFVAPIIADYNETISKLKVAIKHCTDRQQLAVLKEILDDMTRAKKTAEAYYKPGGEWDTEYCILSYINGSMSFGHASVVERLVIERLDASSRREQLAENRSDETRFEAMYSFRPDGKAAASSCNVLVPQDEPVSDSRRIGGYATCCLLSYRTRPQKNCEEDEETF